MVQKATSLVLKVLMILLLGPGSAIVVYALDSDREQPATLDADDFEMDFKTGVRIYRGDVIFRQGSIRLNCEELTTYLTGNDELDKAVCVGSPGRFKQRPQDAETDVIGIGLEIVFDQINEVVVMTGRAKVTQDQNTMTGRLITYDLVTEKVRAKGGGSSIVPKKGDGKDDATAAGTAEQQPTTRPRMVIQPRKKKGS